LPEIEAGLRAALGHGDFNLSRHDHEPRQRFGVTVTSAQPFDLAALARLGSVPGAAHAAL
jgi:hypothetical protein